MTKCKYHTNYETPVSAGGYCTKFGLLCDSPLEDFEVDKCEASHSSVSKVNEK